MRAIVQEYDSRLELWFISSEVKVYDQTERKIKTKFHWWQRPRWFYKKALGLRFEVLID